MASAVVMMMMMDGTTQAKTKVAKSATRHVGTRRAKHVTRRRPSVNSPSHATAPTACLPQAWDNGFHTKYKNPLSMWYLIQMIQCITDDRLNL
jgi:hypothetical protein